MRPKKRGLPMIIIGVLLVLIGSPLAFVTGVVVGFATEFQTFHQIDAGSTYTTNAGQSYELYADLGPASSAPEEAPKIACRVTSDGQAVELAPPVYGPEVTTRDGRAYVVEGYFDGPRDGPVHLTCGDHPVAVDTEEGAWQRLWHSTSAGAGIGSTVALGLFCLGIVLLVTGAVVRHRTNEKIAAFDREAYYRYYGRW